MVGSDMVRAVTARSVLSYCACVCDTFAALIDVLAVGVFSMVDGGGVCHVVVARASYKNVIVHVCIQM